MSAPANILKVLHVIPSLGSATGGAASNLVGLAFAQQTMIQPQIYTTDSARPASARPFQRASARDFPVGADRLDLQVFPTRRPYRWAFSPRLADALREHVAEFDLVHVHSLFLHSQFATYRSARRARVPYIVSPHGSLDPYLRRRSSLKKSVVDGLWQRAMLESAAAIHVATEDEARLTADIAPRVPRLLVPNGLATDRFRDPTGGDEFRSEHLSGHDGPVVMFLGRITEKKGIDILIRAFGLVLRHHPHAILALVGPDDERLTPRLLQIVRELGIGQEAVRFTGGMYEAERLRALSAADVWVLSSHTENFGIAVPEAMAAGLPVVVSPAVNLAPDISRAEAGVVAELTPTAFASAISELLADGARRSLLGERARQFAARYDWNVVAPEMTRAYRRVVASP